MGTLHWACDGSPVQSTLHYAHLMLVLNIYCIAERCLFACAIHVKFSFIVLSRCVTLCGAEFKVRLLSLMLVECSHHGNSMYMHTEVLHKLIH